MKRAKKALEQEIQSLLSDPEDFELVREKFRALLALGGDSPDISARHHDSKLSQEPGLAKAIPGARWQRGLDLPEFRSYGGSTLSSEELEKQSKDNIRPEDLSNQLETALVGNARLREENGQLRARIGVLEGSLEVVEHQSSSSTIPGVVEEARERIEEIPEVDLSSIPLFVGGRGTDPLAHLKDHYGQWLSYFGASRNVVWLHQVRKHDGRLVKALQHRLVKVAPATKVGDILPTRAALGDEQLNGKTLAEITRDSTLARLAYARLHQLLYKQGASTPEQI